MERFLQENGRYVEDFQIYCRSSVCGSGFVCVMGTDEDGWQNR